MKTQWRRQFGIKCSKKLSKQWKELGRKEMQIKNAHCSNSIAFQFHSTSHFLSLTNFSNFLASSSVTRSQSKILIFFRQLFSFINNSIPCLVTAWDPKNSNFSKLQNLSPTFKIISSSNGRQYSRIKDSKTGEVRSISKASLEIS